MSHKLLTLLALLTICYLTYLVKGKNHIFVLILPHCRLERLANLVSQPIGAMARMSQAVNNPAGFLKQFAERCCFYKVSLVPSIIAMHCLDMFADNKVTLICFFSVRRSNMINFRYDAYWERRRGVGRGYESYERGPRPRLRYSPLSDNCK